MPDTPDILKKIVEVERRRVERRKVDEPAADLERRIEAQSPPLNLAGALLGDRVRVIAEVKKASPAAGAIREDVDPAALAAAYAEAGAAAISVLTNMEHFRGSLEDMAMVREAVNPRGLPVLRKEFVFDPYQVHEARAHGADAILLIVAILTPRSLRELMDRAQELWMQCLVEVHDEEELRAAIDAGAEIVGVNNRDLHTFKTDLGVTERLAPAVPSGKIIVSESGIRTRADLERARRAGAQAVLVGEALVSAADPGAKLRELL